ncbi:MAG: CHASE2 domain-containing protein, partial [Bdellovibrionales bacterium]|nr:CHASE2 domain-containing protein [Bdellovibrionales bacterium]
MFGQFFINFRRFIPPFEIQIRLFFIWIASLFLLKYDQSLSFDTRFQVRGNLNQNNDIIILTLRPNDIQFKSNRLLKNLILLNDNSQLNDTFYWDADFWVELINSLLRLQPKGIGITLNLVPTIEREALLPIYLNTLFHHNVFWINAEAARFQDLNSKSTFLNELGLVRDPDGIIRRFERRFQKNFAERITKKNYYSKKPTQTINYLGSADRYIKYSLSELLNQDIRSLKNKYFIINASTNSDFEFNSP